MVQSECSTLTNRYAAIADFCAVINSRCNFRTQSVFSQIHPEKV